VIVFSEMMPFVVEALQGMTRWDSPDTKRTALQLLNSILTPQLIVYLVVLEIIVGYANTKTMVGIQIADGKTLEQDIYY